MAGEVKNENYIVIQGWMINDLDIKGNEVIIYAIIYGFTQTEGQIFSGSLQYLANWTRSTKQGVSKNLKSLVEKGYIVKKDKYINGVKFCEYYATKLNTVCNKVDEGMQQSLTPPMQQSLTNNISLNNASNNTNNKKDRKNTFIPPTLEEIKSYCKEKGYKIDVDYFFNYFNEGKWIDSKGNKVNNWKQKVISWDKYSASNKNTRTEIVPEWLKKETKADIATEEELVEFEKKLNGYEPNPELVARLKDKYKK